MPRTELVERIEVRRDGIAPAATSRRPPGMRSKAVDQAQRFACDRCKSDFKCSSRSIQPRRSSSGSPHHLQRDDGSVGSRRSVWTISKCFSRGGVMAIRVSPSTVIPSSLSPRRPPSVSPHTPDGRARQPARSRSARADSLLHPARTPTRTRYRTFQLPSNTMPRTSMDRASRVALTQVCARELLGHSWLSPHTLVAYPSDGNHRRSPSRRQRVRREEYTAPPRRRIGPGRAEHRRSLPIALATSSVSAMPPAVRVQPRLLPRARRLCCVRSSTARRAVRSCVTVGPESIAERELGLPQRRHPRSLSGRTDENHYQ